MRQRLKQVLWDASPTLFNLVTRPRRGQNFSIGIFAGNTPLELTAPQDLVNPVLTSAHVTDVPAAFVADPFMIFRDGRWFLFFEVMNKVTRNGQIAVATSEDGREWSYLRTVLAERFHVAYPYVFIANGQFYMVPDTPDVGVLLYKAVDFPFRWERAHTLLSGGRFSDSSIFEYHDSWWMLTAWSLGRSSLKSLRLFYADTPSGPWQEHPQSPVIDPNETGSRPAGRVLVSNGRSTRFAQDSVPEYGSQVHAYEILELTRTTYSEVPLVSGKPVLSGCGNGWNADGMHHVDAHRTRRRQLGSMRRRMARDTLSASTIPPIDESTIDESTIDIRCDTAMDDRLAAEWDLLLERSDANIIFLTSGWLRAWHETLGRDDTVLFGQVRSDGHLVAAGAFHIVAGVVQFAGTGPSDYSDFIILQNVTDASRADLTSRLLRAVKQRTPRFRYFKLGRICPESRTLLLVSAPSPGFHSTAIGRVEAPYMDMALVNDRLRKKSLRRHERGLQREGSVECATLTAADEVLASLDAYFFEQHVRRWASTGIESLFSKESYREFYRCVTRRLGPTGQIRFTTIRLSGVPVAAHFGFLHAGKFIWYKPSFEPTLSKLSPGEVLIKHLMELAKKENATEFDFTIGSEPFKYRFASGVRQVVYLHVTDSLLAAYARRARALAGGTVRKLLRRS